MKTHNLLYLILLLCFSCTDDSDLIEIGTKINLSNLQEGQESRYVRYTSQCATLDDQFEFKGDTLVLRVVKEKEDLYLEESLSPFSRSIKNGQIVDPIRYPVIIETGKLVLPERTQSHLFNFYGSDDLHLWVQAKLPTLFQKGCQLELRGLPFIGDEIARLNSFQVGPLEFYQKIAVSCVPTILNLDAYLIYDEDQLYMSHTMTESTFNNNSSFHISGWCLVE